MKKRGRTRPLDSIRAPSHKHHHHRAVLTAGFTAIGILLVFGFLYAVVDSSEPLAGQVRLQDVAQCAAVPEGIFSWWDGTYQGGRVAYAIDKQASGAVGRRGVLESHTHVVDGKVGFGFRFDGIDDHIEIPDSPNFEFGSRPFTIEGWFKTDSVEEQYLLSHLNIVRVGINPRNGERINRWKGYAIAINRESVTEGNTCGVGRICFRSDVDGQWHGVDAQIELGSWTHFALTREGNSGVFYINGERVGDIPIEENIPDVDTSIRIGARNIPNDQGDLSGFDGIIDELTFYHTNLDGQEIQDIFESSTLGKCREEVGLLCYDNIDNDQDGDRDCEENSCQEEIEVNLGAEHQFELEITSQICEGSSYTLSLREEGRRPQIVPQVHICDEQYRLEQDETRVAFCAGQEGGVLDILSSYVEAEWDENVNIYYDGPDEERNKKISILYTVDLDQDVRLNQGNFVSNLLNGQKLAIKLGDDLYLLSHNEDQELYSPERLRLTHLPSKDEFPAQVVVGTLQVQFNLKGGRIITIRPVEEQALIEIIPREPDESAQSFADPFNLEQSYEVQVTAQNPARITNPANLGIFSICRAGENRDREQVHICKDNRDFQTPRKNHPTVANVGNYKFALLYEDLDGEKAASMMRLYTLPSRVPAQPTELNYFEFIDNMVEGRRVAFEFEDKLYIMSHESEGEDFSLNNIRVIAYGDEGTVSEMIVEGNEARQEITLLDGAKMWLSRQYPSPPGNFQVIAKTLEQQQQIDLNQELFSTISSLGPTRFILNELGVVQKHPDDNINIEGAFELDTGANPHLVLNYREPQTVANEALVYYDVIHVNDEGTPVKGAKIYRYYDLAGNIQQRTRAFDNDFAQKFAQGNQLALQMQEDTFYLLGHENPDNEQAIFRNSNLRLYSLEGSQTFEPIVENAQTTHFDVPEGKITVVTNVVTDTMTFSKTTQRDLDQQELSPFMATLTTNNTVQLKSGQIIQMCFVNALQDRRTVRICEPNNQNPLTSVETTKVFKDNQNNLYLFETNGEVQDGKELTIRLIENINERRQYNQDRYLEFIENIQADQYPMFNISNTLYYPQAQNTLLETFSLVKYPLGPASAARETQEKTPLTYNASFVLHDRVVFASQEENNDEQNPISLSLRLEPYYYVPEDGSALVLNTTRAIGNNIEFKTSLLGKKYKISFVGNDRDPARVKLEIVGGNVLFNRFFAQGDSRNLILDGVPITITYESFNEDENEAVITIQRQ